MRSTAVFVWLLALPLAATLACGGSEEETVATLETDEGTVTIEQEEGTLTYSLEGGEKIEMKTGADATLPDDFPEDLPLYPDSSLVASMTSPDGTIVTSRTDASLEEVLAFYKRELGDEGWEVDTEMNLGEQRMLSFSKGERQATVTASSHEGGTQIALMAGK